MFFSLYFTMYSGLRISIVSKKCIIVEYDLQELNSKMQQ